MGSSRVSVVRGGDRRANITRALGLLRVDIDRCIARKSSDWLFVKVNAIDTNFPLAVTSPEALEAVLDHFYDEFERVIVGDNSFVFSKYPNSNIYTPIKKRFRRVEFSDLSSFNSKEIKFRCLDGARDARISLLPEEAFTISLSVPKTHDYFVFTGCAKNMVGCVTEGRAWIHGVRFVDRVFPRRVVRSNRLANQNLVAVIANARADLNVLDGFVAMEGEGPLYGDGVDLGIAICGEDAVAVDSVAVRVMGLNNVPYLKFCERGGLGRMEGVEVVRDGFGRVEEVCRRLRPHRLTPYQQMTEADPSVPVLDIEYLLGVLRRSYRLRDKAVELLRSRIP
ncbi:MAG: DUF362 domain-containing protein [Candidatus Bathyarchaeia archaeon]